MIGSSPVFSVSDFVAVFNQSLDAVFPDVVIVGELANFRVSKGKWVYFDLKDSQSSVKFFGVVTTLPGPLEDGMMVEVSGQPRLHQQFGFSIQFYKLRATGEGAIAKAYLLLYKKLADEGLFDVDRKRKIPEYPERIGLIASKQSAGYGDFMKIAKQRWPSVEINNFDVLVQGKNAPEEIVEAIKTANNDFFDVLVIIRGGGSRDDLTAFDDERVVRQIAVSRTPTVVAIGHERDEVLAELASDLRASTPSNAAEMILPDIKTERTYILTCDRSLKEVFVHYSESVSVLAKNYQDRLDLALSACLDKNKIWLDSSNNLLSAYDPKSILKKGYALVYTNNRSRLIRSKLNSAGESEVIINFFDGSIKASLE